MLTPGRAGEPLALSRIKAALKRGLVATRPAAPAAPVRAAQYLRMSTEHQRYSLEHQAVWIASYAAEHGYEIVRTYSDAGKSGLRIEGRDALVELLGDVVGRQAGFTVILVLDVSRWGRFQDPDQAAHYEFICKAAGVRVEYCAEAFENDGSVMSALLKQFKRAMAAEFSRELSVKIAKVQRGLAAKGYRQGGPAGYGLRRQVVNEAGEPCGLLAKGEQKADGLNADERAKLEVTVEEILDEVDRNDADRIDAAADIFQERAQTHHDIEAAAVALLIVASLREHALKVRHGLN